MGRGFFQQLPVPSHRQLFDLDRRKDSCYLRKNLCNFLLSALGSLVKSEILKIFLAFLLAVNASIGLGCALLQAQTARPEDFYQMQSQPTPPPFPDPRYYNTSAPVQLQTPPPVIQQPEIIYTPPATFGQPIQPPIQSPAVPTQSPPFPYFPYQEPDPFAPVVGSGVAPPQQPGFPGAPTDFTNPQVQSYQGTNSSWMPTDWTSFNQAYLQPLIERPRARQTYIYGKNEENQLGINEVEIATTLAKQNFLNSNQPLRISPGFIFHWWDGPNSIDNPGFDLPPSAYSILLSFDHLTNPANQMGLENSFTVGFYSDFDNDSSDGLRFTGRVLGWSRLNAYTVAKIGVEYFDRIDVKMLPAFGVFMAPNADTKLELFFPKTKLAHRLQNMSGTEAWAYFGGEYGGGSWVIERSIGVGDQVDINDIRVYLGIEWMGPRRVTGFFEAGYVFQRELLYRSAPSNILELEDSFMIRSGFAF
jgi:hypothetical protein